MSVAKEAYGIISCINAVCAAYKDGGKIINKLKVKRAQRRALPPSRLLEESIDQASEEIEREKQRGISKFGRAFEAGDHVVVIALQQITIELQSTLLEKLRNAVDDDEATDFIHLVDAADVGRDRTIGALLEFRKRLMVKAPVNELSHHQTIKDDEKMGATLVHQSQFAAQLPTTASTSPPMVVPTSSHTAQRKLQAPTWFSDYPSPPSSNVEVSGDESSIHSGATAHKRRTSSLLGFFNKHNRHEDEALQQMRVDRIPLRIRKPFAWKPAFSSKPAVPPKDVTSVPPVDQQRPIHPALRQDVSSDSNGRASDKTVAVAIGYDHMASPNLLTSSIPMSPPAPTYNAYGQIVSPSSLDPSGASNPILTSSPVLSNRTFSSNIVTNATSGPTFPRTISATPRQTMLPSPDNNYLGFCKSAWKLQNGDRKAMTKCREFNDGWSQASVYYLSCSSSKCAFAGHGDIQTIMNKVWTMERHGIKFRWPFLAKFHVAQQKVKEHKYAYQCIFCVLLGQSSLVIHGTDYYLDHIQSHRALDLGEVILHRTKCIVGRVAEDKEDFDINLWPLRFQQSSTPSPPSVLSDELLEERVELDSSSEVRTSLSANEPWNAGLSDFQWSAEVDRAELPG
ncbi:Hypothetical protein R9X50_00704100 [Acrodontium crateriforme]|uniref:Uncharacterized protein n=1 Tax=Acrodontium crateriforme TaxID=150365 RepID=A0AAQ3RCI4_9PEZI|nr:Hypothetical protein R9X50_00704100 [Acrodontium crateriforme]